MGKRASEKRYVPNEQNGNVVLFFTDVLLLLILRQHKKYKILFRSGTSSPDGGVGGLPGGFANTRGGRTFPK